jgi:hypothetical protein
MPLDHTTITPLEIPNAAFNADGLAVLLLRGTRETGTWVIQAGAGGEVGLGQLQTFIPEQGGFLDDPHYPDLAVETAFVWLNEQARRQGWRVVSWECLNAYYDPEQRPFYCAARAVVVNRTFIPVQNEQTLETLELIMGGPASTTSGAGDTVTAPEDTTSSSVCVPLANQLLVELDTAALADGCSREEKARRILTAVLTTPILSGRRVARTQGDLLADSADRFALQLERIRRALREASNDDGAQLWDEQVPAEVFIRQLISTAGLRRRNEGQGG